MYYFDNSATTKPKTEVLDTFQKVASQFFANPSSVHQLGEDSKSLLNQARQQIAEILAFNSEEIYFTSSGTESNNWVFKGILDALSEIHPNKKRVIISAIEHASMTAQIDYLTKHGFQVDLAPVTQEGYLDLDQLDALLDEDVLILSTMAVNNEIGSLQPLEEVTDLLKAHPQVVWHVDAVQAVTSQLSTVRNSRIDLLTLSSHKFHALRGVGILAKRQRVAAHPLLDGGGQEFGMRSSTENLAGIVSASKALRIAFEEQTHVQQKLAPLQTQIKDTLTDLKWHVFTPEQATEHIICAALPPVPGEVLVHALERADIYISTTSACSSHKKSEHATLRAMGVSDDVSESAIRISMSSQTTQEEVDYLCHHLTAITKEFNIGKDKL